MIYGFGDPRNTKVSEQSANLCSANPSLWHPSLPPSLPAPPPPRRSPPLPSPQPLAASPFRSNFSPTRRTAIFFGVPPTRGSRKFSSRSRNYNYPLGYERYAASSRCARLEVDLRQVVRLPHLRSGLRGESIACEQFHVKTISGSFARGGSASRAHRAIPT